MMRPTRPLAVVLATALLATLSCTNESPTTPVAPPEQSLLGGLLSATGLLSCSPMPTASATATIGPNGGTMVIGPHRFVVPPGALESPVTITALAPSDRVNRVVFQPSGLQFERSASLTMSYANCNLLGKLLPKRIAYVDDNLSILSYLLSLDNLFAKKVTGQVEHFSTYAVAW